MVMLVSELRPDSCVVAEVRASPNHSERKNGMMPDMIVLHYTGTRDTEAASLHLIESDLEKLRRPRAGGRRRLGGIRNGSR